VRDLIQLQVEILQVQQPALDGGLGVQGRLLRSRAFSCQLHLQARTAAYSRMVQASVRSVEM
jgi:hypothetical protein